MTSNKYSPKFLGTLAVLAALLPAVALAAPLRELRSKTPTSTPNRGTSAPKTEAGVCERLEKFVAKLDKNLSQAENRLKNTRSERTENLQERKSAGDQKLGDTRVQADDNREQHYAKLEKRAETDGQKQAVIAFQKAVEAAINIRRLAVDEAISDFRQGLANAAKTRADQIERARDNYVSAVQTAKDKAKADCAKTNAASAKAQLLADLQAARQQLQADIQAADKIKTSLEQLKKTRRAAIDKAFDDFHTAFKTALSALKAAFQKSTDDSPDSSSQD